MNKLFETVGTLICAHGLLFTCSEFTSNSLLDWRREIISFVSVHNTRKLGLINPSFPTGVGLVDLLE
jgi:hypothetical protein